MLERYSRLRLAVEMANDKQVGAPAVLEGRHFIAMEGRQNMCTAEDSSTGPLD
jgi:hypothetical protein